MSWRDPHWKYTNADETRKPNYLRDKFKRIAKELAEQRQKHEHTKQVVRQIKVGEAK